LVDELDIAKALLLESLMAAMLGLLLEDLKVNWKGYQMDVLKA